jgi:hypothetical protein
MLVFIRAARYLDKMLTNGALRTLMPMSPRVFLVAVARQRPRAIQSGCRGKRSGREGCLLLSKGVSGRYSEKFNIE